VKERDGRKVRRGQRHVRMYHQDMPEFEEGERREKRRCHADGDDDDDGDEAPRGEIRDAGAIPLL